MGRDPYTGQSSDLGPLFSKPLARTSDPLPSRLAAKEIRESGVRDGQMAEAERALREYVDKWATPPTTRELCAAVADTSNPAVIEGIVRVFGRRLSDLEHAGRVRRAGMRTCRLGKRLATTWEPTR